MKLDMFSALRHRNYALFFAGQSLSYIGTWMQRTAVSWVIYTQTHSAVMLGVSVFIQQFPSFLLSLAGGIVSDRYDRKKIFFITQSASLVQAAALWLLVFIGNYQVWEILFLSAILGVINAFDVPARQPMVHQLVESKEDLSNALALNSAMVNLARMIGPALSGIILQAYGAGFCFLLNALSFVGVLASLIFMRFPKFIKSSTQKSAITDLKEGFDYLITTPSIGIILLLLTTLCLFVFPYDTVIPVFTKFVFKGDAKTFGYISGFIGLGALIGALLLASLKNAVSLQRLIFVSGITTSISLILFSKLSYFPLAMFFAANCGFGVLLLSTISVTILQKESAPEMRGRVMSYYALAYFGMIPIGGLLVGSISQFIGAPNTMLFQGMLALGIIILFSKFRYAKPKERQSFENNN
jgi:MFS family permease